jgi:TP901 family phage tail tape measure protein
MADKNLSLGVRIGATLDGTFNTVVGGARAKFAALGSEIKGMAQQRGLIERVEQDQAALQKARLNLEKTQAQVRELKLALHKDPQNAGLAKELAATQARAEKLSRAVTKQKGALDKSTTAMRKAGIEVGDMAREYSRLGQSLDKTKTKYEAMQRAMARKQAAGKRLDEMKGRILGMAGAVYAAGRMIGQAADFEAAEVRLSTVLNTKDLPGDLAKAKQHALDFARTGLSSETEMLDIQYALNSAGLDASAARMGSDIVAKVSKITNGSAEGVGEVVATTFNNLGSSLEGSVQERLTRIGELLTKAQFKFQIRDFDQLGESLKYATPALAQFGVPLEQGVTLLGELNSAGMQGSMAGTSLAATFRQLGKASKEFGFEISRDADGNLDFVQTLQNLSDSIGGFDGMDQATIDRMQKAFGEEGQRGVVLLGKKLQSLAQDQQEVAAGSKGLIDKSYQRFLNSTSGQITLLTNNLRILGTTFAGTLLPAVNAAVKPLAAAAKWSGALIERFPMVGKVIGAVAAVVGIFIGATLAATAASWLWNAALVAPGIGTLISKIGALSGAQIAATATTKAATAASWALGAAQKAWAIGSTIVTTATAAIGTGFRVMALAVMSNPIGLAIAGIALAAGLVIKYWEPIKGFFSGIWGGIKSIFTDGVAFLTKVWELSPLGLLFKAGQKLAGFVGGLFGGDDKNPAPGATQERQPPPEQPPRSGRLRRAAAAATLGTALAVTPVAAQTSRVQPPKAPTVAGQALYAGHVQPTQAPALPSVPPPARSGEAVGTQTTINAPITIHAAPGMDERRLAAEVSRALDERQRQAQARQRGVLYD